MPSENRGREVLICNLIKTPPPLIFNWTQSASTRYISHCLCPPPRIHDWRWLLCVQKADDSSPKPRGPDPRDDSANHYHSWCSFPPHVRPLYCNVCRQSLASRSSPLSLNALSCEGLSAFFGSSIGYIMSVSLHVLWLNRTS